MHIKGNMVFQSLDYAVQAGYGLKYLLLWWHISVNINRIYSFSFHSGALMEQILEWIAELNHWHINLIRRKINLLIIVNYQSLNGAIPSRKCSIKAPAQYKTSNELNNWARNILHRLKGNSFNFKQIYIYYLSYSYT